MAATDVKTTERHEPGTPEHALDQEEGTYVLIRVAPGWGPEGIELDVKTGGKGEGIQGLEDVAQVLRLVLASVDEELDKKPRTLVVDSMGRPIDPARAMERDQ